jgi:hypothetical protein
MCSPATVRACSPRTFGAVDNLHSLRPCSPALHLVPNCHSNPIARCVRRKRQRLPPSLLIENAAHQDFLTSPTSAPAAFPIKASDNPGAISPGLELGRQTFGTGDTRRCCGVCALASSDINDARRGSESARVGNCASACGIGRGANVIFDFVGVFANDNTRQQLPRRGWHTPEPFKWLYSKSVPGLFQSIMLTSLQGFRRSWNSSWPSLLMTS